MKTEQEQIKAIKKIIDERVETTLGQVQGRHGNVIKTVDTIIIARDIVDAGYGDVSEYKAEIERLEDENNRLQEIIKQKDDICYWCENSALQAKINVLTELKTRAFQGYQVGMYIVNTEQIDTMIEELKK